MNTVYVISGPLGVGKSSIAKKISEEVQNTVLVEGDIFFLALEDVESISWEQRLQLSLDNIISVANNYLRKELNVAIDFADEAGADWFREKILNDVQLRYVVLIADEETLSRRLEKRGDSKYLSRSLSLLEKLKTNPSNQKYLLNVTNKTIDAAAQEVITNDSFVVK